MVSYTSVFENRSYRPHIAMICKAPVLSCYNRFPIPAVSKSVGTGFSITAVFESAKKKTLGQDDFFCSDLIKN